MFRAEGYRALSFEPLGLLPNAGRLLANLWRYGHEFTTFKGTAYLY
jgi:hypothetical protein